VPENPYNEINKIVPPAPQQSLNDGESQEVWGFKDSRFEINDRGHVILLGDRYDLSGHELPDLLPWAIDMLGFEINKNNINPAHYPTQIPEPINNESFIQALNTFLNNDQLSIEPTVRLRHGHGHTQAEMYAIKYGRMERVPDLVVYPINETQVISLVQQAVQHDVVLIPYGGGTSVTEALMCPANEKRMIISVDMKRMNQILWIDPVNRMACIQAGAIGRDIMKQLAEYGVTMGHEPDSIEFSTLGGWIATNASGMKKNKYGNIESLLLDVNVVTATGQLQRSSVSPRESIGIDPRLWMLGSEGNLGIITSAVVKLFALPETQHYGSVIFPSFEQGTAFMYDLAQTGQAPASVRLVDNQQFQFSMALKPASYGLKSVKNKIEKWVVTQLKGYEPDHMVACSLVFEGRKQEVTEQERLVYKIARRHKGMKAGSENGKKGYELTFSIAYIRDWLMGLYVLGESFETSVPWSQLQSLYKNVIDRVWEEHRQRNLPGKPFINCRVTQIYDTGACVYFYLGLPYKGVDNPTQVFAEIENAARQEILQSGGSLSHHHGIGKLRQRFIPQIMSQTLIEWVRGMKQVVDPSNIFGCGNLPSSTTDHIETQVSNGKRGQT
jgi:alkyldihydroxyacetonephosphate synthase